MDAYACPNRDTLPPLLDIQQNGMGDVVLACWLIESAAGCGRSLQVNPRRWSGLPRLLGIPSASVTAREGRSATQDESLGLRYEYRLVQQALEGGALPKSRFALWAEALGLTGSDGGPLAPVRPRHCEDLSDRAWASAQWDMLQAPALAPRVLLFPDSAKRIRRWPKAQFVEIAARLKADGWAVAAMGAKRASLVGIGCRFWFGYPVDQVASMIAQADLVITNDTGPAHLAGTLGTPTLALCGPTDGRVVFSHMPEVTPLTAIGSAAPPCAPCHFSEPIGYGARCREEGCLALMALTPDDVLDAARQRLAETLHLPPGQPARAVA